MRARKRVSDRIHTWYGCTAHAENGRTVYAQRETIFAHRTTSASCLPARPRSPRSCAGLSVALRRIGRGQACRPREAARQGEEGDGQRHLTAVEDPSDGEARQLRDEAHKEVKRIEAKLVNVAEP
ncbi:MAG: hypothetical protein KIT31_09240 [Deltaproteobacteria bacterium]|nr:hypothetical protein [Deltaproteobacteria bacterium]